MNIDKNWHKDQIQEYTRVYPDYKLYAQVLEDILKRAADIYAPFAIPQSRAKTVSSFAEKIVRKQNYTNPLEQMTDLCGARIITHTISQTERISHFIRESFTIDEKNSQDVSERLRISEFGYLSVHYIVKPKRDNVLGIKIPTTLHDKWAEIQVRTLLQHTWADISHDRLYKTALKIPDYIKRESFRLAAMLESADNDFNVLANTVDVFLNNYEVYLPEEKLEDEVEALQVIIKNEPDVKNKVQLVLKLSRIFKLRNNWQGVIDLLEPFFNTDSPLKNTLHLELGIALCQHYKDKPKSKEFSRGLEVLRDLVDQSGNNSPQVESLQDPDRTQAKALAALAGATSLYEEDTAIIRDLFLQAYSLDITNPYYLVSYIEWEMVTNRRKELITALRPVLMDAINRCNEHIRLGLELPKAFFTRAKLWLLLQKPYESMNAFTRAIHLCTSGMVCINNEAFEEELAALDRLFPLKNKSSEYNWVKLLLEMGRFIKTGDKQSISSLTKNKSGIKSPVVIIAGGAGLFDNSKTDVYTSYLNLAFDDFNGTLMSGGTLSGIPGIVGTVVSALREKGNKNINLLGYLPRKLPANATIDKRYNRFIKTNGTDFSPLEPLVSWIDLLYQGIEPTEIKVLGFGGGPIALFEYKLALSLGARVGLIESSERAVSEIINDEEWRNHPGLSILPDDIMTIRAFVKKLEGLKISGDKLEQTAQLVHENYVEARKKDIKEDSMADWEGLDESFKQSNRHQVMHMEATLKAIGYAIREVSDPEKVRLPVIKPAGYEKMAEIEHGRFNAERFIGGWRYGKTKDVANKISPYLVAWEDLTEDIKDYDREAVKEFPVLLKKAGFEIYKSEK